MNTSPHRYSLRKKSRDGESGNTRDKALSWILARPKIAKSEKRTAAARDLWQLSHGKWFAPHLVEFIARHVEPDEHDDGTPAS